MRGPAETAAAAPDADLAAIRERAARELRENILPFWTRETWDADDGGFVTHLDARGRRTGVRDKYLVMQARMIWTLAAAHRHGLTRDDYLELAGRGVAFLRERMWDARHDGFYWSVRPDGSPLHDFKWLYGQSFAIYALVEYHLAARDAAALALAERVFSLIERRARDAPHGYRERFSRRWRPAWRRSARGRTLDAHVHLLEAYGALAHASAEPRVADALRALRELLLTRAIDPDFGCGIDRADRRWRRTRNGAPTTSYGHDVELAWLLLDTCAPAGESDAAALPVARRLVDHALDGGFDSERGGLARWGPLSGHTREAVGLPEERIHKSFWEQAELLVALVELWRRTGAADDRRALVKHADWIWHYQVDRDGGDWHALVSWDGRPLPPHDKGTRWKGPYHSARAMMRTERALAPAGRVAAG